MIVVMSPGASREQVNDIVQRIRGLGLGAHLSEGEERTIIGVVGAPLAADACRRRSSRFPASIRWCGSPRSTSWRGGISIPRKPGSRSSVPDAPAGTPPVVIGGEAVTLIAGPCSVESEEQLLSHRPRGARRRRDASCAAAPTNRAPPPTSSGVWASGGSQLLAQARAETGLAIITEVMTPSDVALVGQYTDVFQIGARNAQNYLLLEEVGKAGKPVMLKRGLSMLIEEWILAAEYVMAQGNPEVILCERGIRTFEQATRNTFDVSAVPVVQKMSHLPVFVDPSHAAGKRAYVGALALAGIAAGADGLMIEAHPNPDHALSDGAQSLSLAEFAALTPKLRAVAEAVGRTSPSSAA